MKTRVEKLKAAYESLQSTVAGDYVYQALVGFAEILDNSKNIHDIDTDLVDIYWALSFKNGTTMQLTGQITEIEIDKDGNQTNIVKIMLEDRKAGVMPNTTFIFSLNEVYTIQALDVVTHQRKLAERYAAEEDRNELVESPVATEPTASVKEKETEDGEEV